MKLKLRIVSKARQLLTASSEEDKVVNSEQLDSRRQSAGHGTKDETFFDSQTWLVDSDCEDDFVSVNGDFVPSSSRNQLGNIFSPTSFPEVISEPPTYGKRSLAELLQESQLDELEIKQNDANHKLKVNGQPCRDDINSPDHKDSSHQKAKKMKPKQRCLSSLVQSLSFKDRRNRNVNEL
ncbi:uncharacterized protein At3g27210-like [Zingiber officinale]|uniref:uncharacterized protein At3g27210-like n=1 Tax=Zingiber officinale TaxID=94328 RepID=UPI001C4B843D|nr:uncharacterized protein At3g27210-like [Zingiber officinale]